MTTETKQVVESARGSPKVATGRAVEAHAVVKEYGEGDNRVQVLRSVNLLVPRGEMLAIMGPSGSGKSTLLGCLSGLDSVTEGRVVINGIDITRLGENALAGMRNRNIGFVFQTFNLIGTLSTQENVELPILLNPRSRFKASQRAAELLELVGLTHRRSHRPAQLSGGEQQRVAIARALANDPEFLFADEPTGNLDSRSGASVMDLLIELNRSLEKTLILVTHDAGIAAHCDRMVAMQDGHLVVRSPAVGAW
jgi:putative ABC transport system ATP-binding protein